MFPEHESSAVSGALLGGTNRSRGSRCSGAPQTFSTDSSGPNRGATGGRRPAPVASHFEHHPALVLEAATRTSERLRSDGVIWSMARWAAGATPGRSSSDPRRPPGCSIALDRGRGGPRRSAPAPRHPFGDRVRLIHASFRSLGRGTGRSSASHGVDGVLLDLGVSSPQLDRPGARLPLRRRERRGDPARHAHGPKRRRLTAADLLAKRLGRAARDAASVLTASCRAPASWRAPSSKMRRRAPLRSAGRPAAR